MREKLSFFLLLIGIAIFISLPVQCVYAYTSQQYIPYQQYSFWYNYTPAGPDPSQKDGFRQNDPIRYNTAEWDSQLGVLHCRAYAMVPMGTTQGYRPNVNVTARLFYNGYFSRPFSYLEVAALNPYLSIRAYHDPPADMGNAEYGYSITRIDAVGGTYYTATAAELYSLADFWYPNNEAAWDYAEADVTLSISGTIITFHWTQLDISASPNPAWKSQPVQFTATLKDGVPPYTVQWNFGGQGTYTAQVSGNIGGVLTSQTQFSFTSTGTFNVTCTATDSRGISDTKWVLITVRAVYLTIQAGAGGTTNPAPGTYEYGLGQQVPVTAQPSSGYALDRWELDSVPSGSSSVFWVIMDANHTLRAVFVQGLTVSASANVTSGNAPLPVQFSSTASGGTPPYAYSWNFGDMGTSDQQNPVHIYSQPGAYTAAVTVTDSAGRKGYASVPITVNSPFNFTVTKSGDITVVPGQSGTSTIFVNLTQGQAQPVSLSIQWVGAAPAGASASISPQSVVPNATSLLTFVAGANTPVGNYTCRVVGTAGALARYVDVLITVSQQVYYLTIQSTSGGTTSPAPGVYAYPAGATVQVSAQPSSGYNFDRWQLDGVDAGSSSTFTVVMNANHTLRALFAQTPSYSPATLTFDIRYYDGMKWAQGDIVPYGIVRYSGAATGQVYSSPTTVTVNVQGTGDVYAYFDPRNTQGSGFVSQWGGTPKAKVYSSYYYIANTTYSQNVAPSSITYPNQYDMLIISGYSHVLSMNVKWAEYPVNVSANAQWGTVAVTSNSPGWSLYSSQYLNYTNGFGVYYVDHSYNIRVQALPFAGYYFDRIVVDGNTTYYDDTVLLDNVVGPHNVTVYFSAVPPTFKLTVQAGDGGTTIPSPGVYYVPRYSYQSVVAYVTAPGYYFSNWLVDSTTDRTGAGTSTSKITVYMDRDHTVTAAFDTEGTVPVRPCYIRDGTQLSRVTLGETVGVNVTVTLPGITSPTNVEVTAWLEGVRWWDWSTNSFRTTTYKFTGTATTNASGFFTVAFGSEIDRSSTCYSVDPSTPLGTQYLARAEVKVGSNTYTYANTWKVDNVMATAEFDYNLTGINATFRFVYVTDGVPARGRNGLYVTALSTGHPYTPEAYSIVNGTSTIRERLSPPCDRDAASRLFIPYSWLNNSTLRATVPLPVWLDYSVYGMGLIPSGYAVKNNITYTTVAAMMWFFNSTCAVVEPFDWGDRVNLPGVEGAYSYLYWDTWGHPWDGTSGLIGVFGPSATVPLCRQGGRVYVNFTAVNSPAGVVPVGERINVPAEMSSIKGILMNYPDVYSTMKTAGSRRLWLQLVPGHSSGVLYNPVKELPILLAAQFG
jgi:PKD repeat protein